MDSLDTERPFVTGSGRYQSPAVSPDGRMVAWVAAEGADLNRGQVFVTALPGPGPRLQVSVSGGHSPIWDPSRARLYFRGPRRIMVADLDTSPLRVTARDSLFEDTYVGSAAFLTRNWDVVPGRNEFLMVKPVEQRASVPRLMLHWTELPAARGARASSDR